MTWNAKLSVQRSAATARRRRSRWPLKPVCLCFAATMPDGEVYTGYYNADATDKAVIAHNIQADITMDIIRTNAAIIKDMIEHCEEDE